MASEKNTDTFWGDFKSSSFGGFILVITKVIVFLAKVTLFALLLYGSLKAVVLTIRRLFGKPLPPREEFPYTWYVFGWMLVLLFIYALGCNYWDWPGLNEIFNVQHAKGWRAHD